MCSLRNKSGLVIWLVFHGLLVLFALRSFPFQVNTDLLSILPPLLKGTEASRAESQYEKALGGAMTILVGAEEFSEARKIAKEFSTSLEGIRGIENLSFEVDASQMQGFQQYLFEGRYRLLDSKTKSSLEAGDLDLLKEQAFMVIYNPVTAGSLDYLEDDPFLLGANRFYSFLDKILESGTEMTLNDSVLTRHYDGTHWVMISMNSQDSGLNIEAEESPVAAIMELYSTLSTRYPEAEILLSGSPFHSYLNSVSSKREITLLSSLSSLFIILMVLLVFRSPKPLFFTLTAIGIGIVSGLASTIAVFREIHIFTIIFGTSLIGISVDYSFHFFSEWSKEKCDTRQVVRKIFPGIIVGFITTAISYAAFTVTDFPLLQQMALFSICGLASTLLSVLVIYPHAGTPSIRSIAVSARVLAVLKGVLALLDIRKKGAKLLLAAMILLMAVGLSQLRLSVSLGDFYTMPDRLLYWESMSAEILGHNSTGMHLLVSGASLEECLREEEAVMEELERLSATGGIDSYMGLSQFIPSEKTQDENLALARKVLFPALGEQYSFLGFSSQPPMKSSPHLTLDDLEGILPPSLLKGLHIGRVGNSWYTSILIFGLHDREGLIKVSGISENIQLMDRVGEMASLLRELSHLMIRIIFISYLVILAGLCFRYGIKRAGLIVGIPLAASLITLAVLGVLQIPVNLFVIVGLILIPGMGTDYLILLCESVEKDDRTVLSISMSFMTTFLAFGMLSFTSIAFLFGLTVSLGIFVSFFLTFLAGNLFREGFGK